MQITNSPGKRKEQFMHLAALAVLCAAAFFYGLGWLPFIGPDEPRYAAVAREMYQSGDWITPRLSGINWFEKPALTYWLAAAGYQLFGVSELAARVGVALLAFGGVLLIYFFGRRVRGARFGYLSAAALATCGLWPGFARGATFDLPLAVSMAAVLCCFFLWEREAAKPGGTNTLWWLMWLALGLAVLAKGLVGIVLPGVIIGLYLLLTRRLAIVLRPRLLAGGIVLFLLTAALWYAPMLWRHGRVFIDEFFVAHHFQRYVSNKYKHPQPFYFFPLVVLAGSFPWTPFLLAAAWRALKVAQAVEPALASQAATNGSDAGSTARATQPSAGSTARATQPSAGSTARATQPSLSLLLWLWLLVPVVFFSFSGSKLPGYILPVFPAVALLVGGELERWWLAAKTRGLQWLSIGAALLLIAAALGASSLDGTELIRALAGVTLLVADVYLLLLFVRNGRAATLFLPFGLAVLIVAAAHLVFPELGQRESLRDLSQLALRTAQPGERLVFFVNADHSVNFYATALPLRDAAAELLTLTDANVITTLASEQPTQSLLILSPVRWLYGLKPSEPWQIETIGADNRALPCSPACNWALLRARRKNDAEP